MSKQLREALTSLELVLCDPEGRSSVRGSDADNAIVDSALDKLRAILAAPAPFGYVWRSKLQVEQQREAFRGEEPDYLWSFTPGEKYLPELLARDDIETVLLYAAPST